MISNSCDITDPINSILAHISNWKLCRAIFTTHYYGTVHSYYKWWTSWLNAVNWPVFLWFLQ